MMSKTMLESPNVMIANEPTNHLDMATVELLAEALTKYDGSIILVSHDRYFISKTANKIWEIEDEKIIEFKGDYNEWVEWKERMAKQKANAPDTIKVTTVKEVFRPIRQIKYYVGADSDFDNLFQPSFGLSYDQPKYQISLGYRPIAKIVEARFFLPLIKLK